MIVEYLLVLGIAMITSALTVYFRDLEYILGIIGMLWMYLTPVLYEIEFISEQYRYYIYLNPMTGVILCYKDILYYKRLPDLGTMMAAIVSGLISLIVGFTIFYKIQKRFVEAL
jgi:ABC-2 type transport system permease protein